MVGMPLEQWFYTLSIIFFFSFWVIVVVAIGALYLLYRRFQELKQSIGTRSLGLIAGSAPALTLAVPVLKKLWSHWRRGRKERHD